MPDLAIPGELWRGGTSRGLVLDPSVLKASELSPAAALAAALGSPDPLARQIDGLGGGTSSSSKAALVEQSRSADHDVDFTFAQVSVDSGTVEFLGNCGNFVSVAGPYAADLGWVPITHPRTIVRIRCTNTQATVVASFDVRCGRFEPEGALAIDGVPGTGSPIRLDWPLEGQAPDDQFPLGLDEFRAGTARVRYLTVGNPLAIVDGRRMGWPSAEVFDRADVARTLHQLEEIRRAVAVLAGVASDETRVSDAIPKLAVVWPGVATCRIGSVTARAISMGAVHRTVPLTVAMGLAADVAARARMQGPATVEVLHPAGAISLEVVARSEGSGHRINSIAVQRTARRLMRGDVLLPVARVRGCE